MPDDQPQPTTPTMPTIGHAEPKKFADYQGTFWVWLLERLGLPTLILATVAWSAGQAVQWIAPRVDKLATKHTEFVDQTSKLQQESLEIQKQNRDIHKDQATILERVIKSQDGTSVTNDEHRRLTLEIRDDVKDIKAAVVAPKGTH